MRKCRKCGRESSRNLCSWCKEEQEFEDSLADVPMFGAIAGVIAGSR